MKLVIIFSTLLLLFGDVAVAAPSCGSLFAPSVYQPIRHFFARLRLVKDNRTFTPGEWVRYGDDIYTLTRASNKTATIHQTGGLNWRTYQVATADLYRAINSYKGKMAGDQIRVGDASTYQDRTGDITVIFEDGIVNVRFYPGGWEWVKL